jgi:histidyl-tRNA synthetase
VDDVVCALGEAQRPDAIRLARRLRAEGRSVELVLGESRPKRVLEDADRAGARRALFLGPAEAERGVVRVRELETGQERDEPLRI